MASAKGREPGKTVWMRAVDTETDFDAVVLQAKGIGATGLKIYAKVPADVMASLGKAARKHGMRVWSHAYVGPAKPSDATNAGVHAVSHISDLAGEVINDYREWRRKGIELEEGVEEASFKEETYTQLMETLKANGTILDATLTVFETRKDINERRQKNYQHAVFLTKLAHKYGIKISAGTDAFNDLSKNEFPKVHYEMGLLVKDGGLSPIEAIQSATIHNAEVIGIENDYGSVSKGKVANLVVLDKDPTENIEHSTSIVSVIKNGEFIYRGDSPNLPFVSARESNGMLWMSGQIGNFPTTMTLAGKTIEAQMEQTLENVGDVLQEYNLTYDDVVKCTLMLEDIDEWSKANEVL